MRQSLLLFFGFAYLAQAQVLSFGVKAGIPLSSPPPFAGLHQNTGRWTAGLTAQYHVASGIYVEADALLRGYSFVLGSSTSSAHSYKQDVTAWDFPFLLKYCFGGSPVRPFVDAGYSLTHESYDVSTLDGHQRASRNGTGPVVGLGVEFKYRRVKVSPEVRYTRLSHSGPSGSNGNLLTALVGVTF